MRGEGLVHPLRFACPELVGRDAEVSLLGRLASAAAAGSATTVLIEGPAGMGKTALVRRIREIAPRSGLRVAHAECVRVEMRRPFGPFVDALSPLVDRYPLVRAAIDLRPVATSTAPATEVDRYRTHSAFARAVREVAEERPLLLAIDDLQWADDASLELVAYLSQRVTGRLMLIAAYRPDDDARRPALRRALGDVARDRRWDLSLAPLAADDIGRALRLILGTTRVTPALRDLLHTRSGGNPLLLEEILRALAGRGDLRPDGAGWRLPDLRTVPVPASVRESVRERYGALGPIAREIVAVAAVIGERFTYGLLREASERSSEELDAALREALAAHLVVELAEPDTFGSSHPLMRDALLGEMLSRDRRAAHRRVASILERDGEPEALAAIAYHFEAAGETTRASRAHERAGEHALRRSAYADAFAHFTRAVELAQDDDARLAALQLVVARIAHLLRRPTAGLAAASDAAARFERMGDRRGLASALLWARPFAADLGRPAAESRAFLDRAFAVLEPLSDPPELAWAHTREAWEAMERHDAPSAREHAERALAIAERADDGAAADSFDRRNIHVMALERLGIVLAEAGDTDGAIRCEREALRIADAEGYPSQGLVARFNLARALIAGGGDRAEADGLIRERDELVARYGVPQSDFARMHELLARPAWDEFLRLYEDAEDETVAWTHLAIHRCLVLVARDGPGHLDLLDPPRRRLLQTEDLFHVEAACAHSAEVLLLAGEPARALEVLDPALSHMSHPTLLAPAVLSAGMYAILAAYRTGDGTAARRWLDALDLREVPRHVRPFASIDHTLRYATAERALAGGDRNAAIEEMVTLQRERRAAHARGGAPWDPTVLTALLGERLIEVLLPAPSEHDRILAAQELAEAAAFWRDAGASWYLERLRERAERWGLAFPQARAPTGSPRAQLTPREREVALLVAKGMTDREIADRLTLSVRTAESHVERIRSKLGLRTRSQVAVWVSETQGSRT